MLIEKTTLIQFDEVAERARIKRAYKGEKRDGLLAILDAFVGGDFAQMLRLAGRVDSAWLGSLAMPVVDILRDLNGQLAEQAALKGGAKASSAEKKLWAMRGIAFGPEAAAYPKFAVLVGEESTPTTVPQFSDL